MSGMTISDLHRCLFFILPNSIKTNSSLDLANFTASRGEIVFCICFLSQELRKKGCKEWSERCSGKRVKAPKGRTDYTFQEKTKKDFEMEDLMESLNGMPGMGGMGGMGACVCKTLSCPFLYFLFHAFMPSYLGIRNRLRITL